MKIEIEVRWDKDFQGLAWDISITRLARLKSDDEYDIGHETYFQSVSSASRRRVVELILRRGGRVREDDAGNGYGRYSVQL